MTISVSQNSFVGGEWAPSLYGRQDLAKYSTAVRTMRNAYPHPHGGASNRGGTEFVAAAKYDDRKARLVEFQFSVVQSYILEFGHQYIRVIKDGGLVIETQGAGTDIVKSGTWKWTASGHGTNEYYLEKNAGGDPALDEPLFVYADVGGSDTVLDIGTLGALAGGEWAYGDNDSLGYDTIYVRLADGTDPDTKAVGYLEASYYEEVATPYVEEDLPLLKFVQSADVLYITHPLYAPRKLSRTAHDMWSLATITFGAAIAAPTGLASAGGTGTSYVVTALTDKGEESVASGAATGAPGNALSWGAVTGATSYNIYKDPNASGTYGLIGSAATTSFTEPSAGISPNFSRTPPVSSTPLSGVGDYPGCATFFEQRLLFARSDNDPQTFWGSVVSSFENLNKSTPLKDDDSYEFTINARQVNEIRWLIPMNDLLIMTSGGEFKAGPGTQGNAITPTSINIRVQSQWGVSDIPPLVIGNSILFVEGSKKVVRDLTYSFEVDGYAGNDLSLLANHLFRNYEIMGWAYQQNPDSIIWVVRNDGVMIGLTYHKEHEVFGWHRHDTDGAFESVACISTAEGVSDLYVIVARTIDGQTVRYIERFLPRLKPNAYYEIDIADAFFVDAGLTYDGWNDQPTYLMKVSGASYAAGATVTLTASGHSPFSAPLVGRYVKLQSRTLDQSDGMPRSILNSIVVRITAYTSPTVVSAVVVNRPVPSELQNAFTGEWALMATTLYGLDHLEGKAVSVLADGNVVPSKTVSGGTIAIDNPAAKVHVGLGYVSDIETLDFEYQTQTGTVQDKLREVKSVVLRLEDTRALLVGPNKENLYELAFRDDEYYGEPTALFTGDKEVAVDPGYERQGRLFMRNVDPVPFTVIALMPRMDHGED